MTLTIEGHVYELREEGPCCSQLFRDGKLVPGLNLHYEGTSPRPGHAGRPNGKMKEVFIRQAHEHLKGRPNA